LYYGKVGYVASSFIFPSTYFMSDATQTPVFTGRSPTDQREGVEQLYLLNCWSQSLQIYSFTYKTDSSM